MHLKKLRILTKKTIVIALIASMVLSDCPLSVTATELDNGVGISANEVSEDMDEAEDVSSEKSEDIEEISLEIESAGSSEEDTELIGENAEEEEELFVEPEFVGEAGDTTATVTIGNYEIQFIFNTNHEATLNSIITPSTIGEHNVSIPSTVTYEGQDYTVVSVSNQPQAIWTDKANTLNITLPKTVKTLGEGAFKGMKGLKNVYFEAGSELLTISKQAFYNCELLEACAIPNSVTAIGDEAFRGCKALLSTAADPIISVDSRLGSEGMGIGVFRDCAAIEYINIPEGVTEIKKEMFYGCKALTTVNYVSKDAVSAISKQAFSGCENLMSSESNSILPGKLEKLGVGAFSGCKVMEGVVIPETLTVISSDAFSGCESLTVAKLHDKVTTLGSSAFATTKIASVDIYSALQYAGVVTAGTALYTERPSGEFTYGAGPFSGCDALSTIEWKDDKVDKVIDDLFNGCSGLESVILPDHIQKVGNNAFSASGIVDISGEEVIAIDSAAFRQCKALAAISFNKAQTLGDSAFEGCLCLSSVNFPEVVKIGNSAFKNAYGQIKIANNQSIYVGLREITFPKVKTIGTYAFASCSLLTSAALSSSLTEIGESAFMLDGNLYKLCISGQSNAGTVDFQGMELTTIGKNAFYNCLSIGQIDMGEKVTSIGERAFSGETKLGTLKFHAPEAYTEAYLTIEKDAFSGCENLQILNFTPNVKVIGESAFAGDLRLMQVTFENKEENGKTIGVSEIGKKAFFHCYRLEGVGTGDNILDNNELLPKNDAVLTIPKSVTSIGESAFVFEYSSDDAESKERPRSMVIKSDAEETELFFGIKNLVVEGNSEGTAIANNAFDGCLNMKTVTLGEGVTSLGSKVFANSGIEKITIPSTLKTNTTVKESPFVGCAIREVTFSDYCAEVPQYIFKDMTSITKISLPLGMQRICDNAFAGCTGLQEVTTAGEEKNHIKGIFEIGKNAFEGCTSLALGNVSFDDNNSAGIGVNAFNGCSAITAITIENPAKVDANAFAGCSALEQFSITGAVGTVARIFGTDAGPKKLSINRITDETAPLAVSAFANCTNIEELTINSVAKIPDSCFEGCSSLSKMILPDDVTTIGKKAFYGCSNLSSLTLKEGLKTIDALAFYGCGFKNVTIPSTVTTTNTGTLPSETEKNGPFAGGALESVTFADRVPKVPSYIFMNTKTLKTVTFADSITTIDKYAFFGCEGIENITIPESITGINENAFENCTSLKQVCIEGNDVSATGTVVGTKAFFNCAALDDLTMEEGVKTIKDMAFSGTNLKRVVIPASLTTVATTSPFAGCEVLTKVVADQSAEEGIIFADGVTTIPNNMFADADNLTEVEIPASIQKIGNNAFKNADNISKVTFISANAGETGTQYINDNAFSGCSALEEIAFPASLLSLGKSAFAGDISLQKVTMDQAEMLKTWSESVFQGCTSLSEVTLPTGKLITTIPGKTFSGCTALTTIEKIPVNITAIGVEAFAGSGIETIVLPSQITKLNTKSFYNCTSLTDLELSRNLTDIPVSCFEGCTSLQNVVIPANVARINDKAFFGSGIKDVTFLGSTEIGTTSSSMTDKGVKSQLSVFENSFDTANNVHILNDGFSINALNASKANAFYTDYSEKLENHRITVDNINHYIYQGEDRNDAPAIVFKSIDAVKVPAESVTLDRNELVINKGETITLVLNIAPANCTDAVEWSSSDTTVVACDAKVGGKITAKGGGTATINVKVGNITKTCSVTVKSPITSFGSIPAEKTMQGGDFFIMKVAVTPADATNKGYKWSNSDPTVASYDATTGKVTALKKGTTTLSFVADDENHFTQNCVITVESDAILVSDVSKFNNGGTYAGNCKDSWIYKKEGASNLAVTFSKDTEVEKDKDYIYLYDATGKKIGTYTGTALAGKTINVTGDTIRVQIVSDETGHYFGFAVESVGMINTITYVLDGGTNAKENPAKYNSADEIILTAPTKKGYRFLGWYTDAEKTNKIEKIAAGTSGTITLYAAWVKVLTVTYVLDGGINAPSNPVTMDAENATAIGLAEPTKDGYIFLGWYTDSAKKNKVTEIPAGSKTNTKLYAAWKQIPVPQKKGTVLSNLSGGNFKVTNADAMNPTVEFSGPASSTATKVTIPATVVVKNVTYKVTSISSSAFKNNKTIQTVMIGSNVTSVRKNAFYGCTSLKKVTIGKNVTKIESSAFRNCSKLTKITIPAKVTSIGSKAFYGCSALKSVTIKSKAIKSMGSKAFGNIHAKATVKVIKSVKKKYTKLLKKAGLNKKTQKVKS